MTSLIIFIWNKSPSKRSKFLVIFDISQHSHFSVDVSLGNFMVIYAKQFIKEKYWAHLFQEVFCSLFFRFDRQFHLQCFAGWMYYKFCWIKNSTNTNFFPRKLRKRKAFLMEGTFGIFKSFCVGWIKKKRGYLFDFN